MKTDKDYLRQLGNMLGDGVRDQCSQNLNPITCLLLICSLAKQNVRMNLGAKNCKRMICDFCRAAST